MVLVLGLVLVFFLSVNTFQSLPIRVYFLFLYLAFFAEYPFGHGLTFTFLDSVGLQCSCV